MSAASDVLIVGGGVIGLSLAWELSQAGAKVSVVDRGPLGREASWAGAGMIPAGPGPEHWSDCTPRQQLAGMSQQLHLDWHRRLFEATGINNGYRASGALYLADSKAAATALQAEVEQWLRTGIECHRLDTGQVVDVEPALAKTADRFSESYLVPQEAQLRNPRHVQALIAACQQQAVDLQPGVAIHDFELTNGRINAAVTSSGSIQAGQFCLTAGCWTGQLASRLGIDLPLKPIRGQIVLLNGPAGLLRRHVNVGKRYLVPRVEGRLLVGSTMEDVGFLKQNTGVATADLLGFAATLVPSASRMAIETSWSGLRPASVDGLPFLGQLPKISNGWIATGHFRAGLQLSTATAVVMRSLLLKETPTVDLAMFGCEGRELHCESARI
ncbi:MAG: FAD-dependent oxidoreductase [Planctomycetales bacterium]|nr:FAD-dependent oxidoreductase [Planctomycetales bacterium]